MTNLTRSTGETNHINIVSWKGTLLPGTLNNVVGCSTPVINLNDSIKQK